MAFSLIDWVRQLADVELGVHAKMVAVMLGRHANSDGKCFPSFPTLCRETGVSNRQLSRALQALQAAGIVNVSSRNGAANSYQLTPHRRGLMAQTNATQALVQTNPRHTGVKTNATQAGRDDLSLSQTLSLSESEVAQGRREEAASPRVRAREHSPYFARFCQLWESEFGQTLSPSIVEPAQEFEERTGGNIEWLEYCFRECVEHNARSLSYLRKVMEGVIARGGSSNGRRPGFQGTRAAVRSTPAVTFESILADQQRARDEEEGIEPENPRVSS